MDENSLPYSQDFINKVIEQFYGEKKSIEEIAERYDVSIVVIKRILTHYNFIKPQALLEYKKPNIKELKEKVREEKGKLTEEDKKDLEIDLWQFGKGEEPKENEDEQRD